MRFEIDDKTGRLWINTSQQIFPSEIGKYVGCTNNQLETILQAVKKTQYKLLNRQIQEIQDSKNPSQEEMLSNSEVKINDKYISFLEIEHNQKIADALIDEYNQLLNVATHFTNKIAGEGVTSDDWQIKRDKALVKRDHLAKLYHKATGEDIKELS